VDPEYNYDHDLGMYVFSPGDKHYSISGELPDYASEPIAMSRDGQNTEQNTVFTCAVSGTYAVVIVNFAPRDNIPFNLEVTVQGRTLADDLPLTGDLNEHNAEDLFQFRAQVDTWSLIGSRLTTDDSSPSMVPSCRPWRPTSFARRWSRGRPDTWSSSRGTPGSFPRLMTT
jgi:hypothetical protein